MADPSPGRNPAAAEPATPGAYRTDLEQAIQEVGSAYLTHLRTLSRIIENEYAGQLAAREKQISDLRAQLEAAEVELSSLRATCDLLEAKVLHYADTLRGISEQLERDAGSILVEEP